MFAFVNASVHDIGDAVGDGHAVPKLLLLSIATTLALAHVSMFLFLFT